MIRLNPGTVRMLRFVFFVSILVHFSTCLLIFVASKNGSNDTNVLLYERTWMTEVVITTSNGSNTVVDSSVEVQYLVGLYWVVTTITTLGESPCHSRENYAYRKVVPVLRELTKTSRFSRLWRHYSSYRCGAFSANCAHDYWLYGVCVYNGQHCQSCAIDGRTSSGF